MRKPEARIFEFVLKEQGYDPSETIFIDDSPQHIEDPKVGLSTYHLRQTLVKQLLTYSEIS